MIKGIQWFKNSPAILKISDFIGSRWFPVALAGVILLCYYLGWDMVMIWFVAVCSVGILTTCRDTTPAFVIFLFMNIIISMKNTPSPLGAQSDYFIRPEIYGQVAAAICVCVAFLVARNVYDVITKKFRPSPMFYGICALCAAFLLNGAFTPEYTAMNAAYGLFLSAVFVCIYLLITCNVKPDKLTYQKVAYYCCVFSAVLAVELIVAYCTYDGLFVDGKANRGKLFFGWGMYNTIGMLLCVCIPAWFYLAVTRKNGFIYTFFGLANVAFAYMTMSRQSIIGAFVVGIVCIVWLLICRGGRDRLINLCIVAAVAVAAAAVIAVNLEVIKNYILDMLGNIEEGGNRLMLWKRAMEDFAKAPLFGVGFYYLKDLDAGFVGLEIIPKMYHSTLFQMLGACGAAGLAAYAVHRVQTIISLFKNMSLGRIYIAITAGTLLIISLFDNHIFYIFPTFIYVGFLGFFKATEGDFQSHPIRIKLLSKR